MQTDRFHALKDSILEGMRDYMHVLTEDGDEADYSEADIQRCGAILQAFMTRVAAAEAGDSAEVMDAVKQAVLDLNALNERCADSLIETDQRERICELIMSSAAAAGVGDGEDITEAWREW